MSRSITIRSARLVAATALLVLGAGACDSRLEPPTALTIIGADTSTTGESLILSPNTLDVRVGGTAQLSVTGATTLLPATFSSDNPAVASVSASGQITGVARGTAIISATSTRDPSRRATAVVRVL